MAGVAARPPEVTSVQTAVRRRMRRVGIGDVRIKG
jgi:hypothetical protein